MTHPPPVILQLRPLIHIGVDEVQRELERLPRPARQIEEAEKRGPLRVFAQNDAPVFVHFQKVRGHPA